MKFTLRFSEPQNVTNPDQDRVQYSFPFAMIDSAFIGRPEQRSQTRECRLIVGIWGSRLAPWRIADADLPKILFEFGRRHIVRLIETGNLPSDSTIRGPMISTASHPDLSCPFDPALIDEPNGYFMEVEIPKPPIGFNFKPTT